MKRDYSKLKGKMTEKGFTREQFAAALGISPTSLYQRLSNDIDFKQSEIKAAAELLGIPATEVSYYFFDF